MLGALGGVTLVAMMLAYRLDRRFVPLMWGVATAAMIAFSGGYL